MLNSVLIHYLTCDAALIAATTQYSQPLINQHKSILSSNEVSTTNTALSPKDCSRNTLHLDSLAPKVSFHQELRSHAQVSSLIGSWLAA